MTYPNIDVPTGVLAQLEQLGTKEKFWYRDESGGRVLFKEGRPGTGENWAEKAACEIAALLGLPHAHYELARFGDQEGVVTRSLVPENGRLILGNEVLAKVYRGYDDSQRYRGRQHTLRRIYVLLKTKKIDLPMDWSPPGDLDDCFGVFTGFLLLDALIGNQDRHHENWGLILTEEGLSLAPTFDHASCLGRNETDRNREDRLTTRDRGRSVATYAARARSALFDARADSRPMSTVAAFVAAMAMDPAAGNLWLSRLEVVKMDPLQACLEQLPTSIASATAREFAFEMLKVNRRRLLSLAGETA